MKNKTAINAATPIAPGETEHRLGTKNWLFFYLSTFFFILNTYVALSMYPGFSLSIGASPFQAGLQNTVLSVSAVLLRFIFGPALDRYSPKPLMLLAIFAYAFSNLLLIASPTYGMLLAMRVVQGFGFAVVLPGISALVAAMAPAGKLGTYLGTTRVFYNLGLLSGPSAALYIIETTGYNNMFIASALSLVISAGALLLVKTPPGKAAQKEQLNYFAQFKNVIAQKAIYPIIGGLATFAFTYSAILSFSAVYIESSAPEANAPLFFAMMGFTGIIASAGVGYLSDRLDGGKAAWPLLFAIGASAVLFFFIPGRPLLVYAAAIIFGLTIQGASLALAKWLIDIGSPKLRATLLSLQENTIDIFFAIGAFAFGAAAGSFGLRAAFLTAGLLTMLMLYPLLKISQRYAPQPESENR